MIKIFIKTDSHYKVDKNRIRQLVLTLIKEKKIKGNIELSINISGRRLIKSLNRKYRMKNKATDVLSFPLNERNIAPFVEPPDNILRLGDIIIAYPEAVSDAANENKLVDDKIDELIIHGFDHLLGIHHD